MPNRFTVTRNGVERSLSALFGVLSPSKFTNVPLKRGDVFSTWQGGGGGYGDPLDRDDERVRVDVLDGYVSREAAERDYGVVLDQRGNVDAEATATVRRSRRSP
jgi:N-methylhydantoinase B